MSPEMIAMLKETAGMFAFLATELTILFLVISYLVGILQEYVTPEKIQSMLSSRNGRGYVVAALLGAITPFCSCSTIPFLKGLLRARAGFGPMLVFLFASPLLNPVIIGLFVVTFGLDVAVFYFLVALSVSISAGFVLEKLGFERYVRPEAYTLAEASAGCGSSCGDTAQTPAKDETTSCCAQKPQVNLVAASCCAPQPEAVPVATSCCATPAPILAATPATVSAATSCCDSKPTVAVDNRWLRVWRATWKDFKQVLPYLLIGILLGSFIYGFIPTELIAEYAGAGKWYAIPIAAVIGIPLYIRAEAVIPLSAALVQKGMALGSVMALIIGSAGASLTEVILLKSIFKNQMIAAFLVVILTMAIGAGYLYTVLFG